jgi:hypothetical protein
LQLPTPEQWAAGDVAGMAGVSGSLRDYDLNWRDVTRITRVAAGMEDLPNTPIPTLVKIYEEVDIPSSLEKDYQLASFFPPSGPPAYRVTGHVAQRPAGVENESVMFYEGGGIFGTKGAIDGNDHYAVSLWPRDYELYYKATVKEPAEGGSYTWDYSADLNRSITVPGPAVVDVTAAAPPTPGILQGSLQASNLTVTGLTGISSPSYAPPVDLTKLDLRATGIVGHNSYAVKAAPASYSWSFSGYYTWDPSISVGVSVGPIVKLEAGATVVRDVVLPTVVPVSLAFTSPSFTVAAVSMSGTAETPHVTYSAAAVRSDSGTWRTAAPRGQFGLTVSLGLPSPANVTRGAFYSASLTIPAAGGEQAISLPLLPEMVTFSGTILSPDGGPAAGLKMSLSASTAQLGYRWAAMVTTDEAGHYSVEVPAGKYMVRIPALN